MHLTPNNERHKYNFEYVGTFSLLRPKQGKRRQPGPSMQSDGLSKADRLKLYIAKLSDPN